jgi:hypothetical protein
MTCIDNKENIYLRNSGKTFSIQICEDYATGLLSKNFQRNGLTSANATITIIS